MWIENELTDLSGQAMELVEEGMLSRVRQTVDWGLPRLLTTQPDASATSSKISSGSSDLRRGMGR
jgi:hypothetical protein